MSKVYFASPWFTPEQEEREERVKAKLRSIGFDVHSPKEEAVCGAFSDPETRKRIFDGNIRAIETADIVFAITDGKDMGTIWEAGYANGYNEYLKRVGYSPITIVYYCETLGNGKFNLMLAQSGNVVITKFEDLDKLPSIIECLELVEGGVVYAGAVE